eukprot:1024523-Prorocentrum_minimum.AAC.1
MPERQDATGLVKQQPRHSAKAHPQHAGGMLGDTSQTAESWGNHTREESNTRKNAQPGGAKEAE